jgi:RNA polymerase sigma-70 factor, ECF subfamily
MITTFSNSGNTAVSMASMPAGQISAKMEFEVAAVKESRPLTQVKLGNGTWVHGHSHASEDELVSAAQSGDQLAFAELCGRHSSVVKRKIVRIVRNLEDAEDILQETLLQAYTHLGSFRRSCRFSTWLTSIGVNSALMLMRKRKVRREVNACANGSDEGRLEVKEPVDRSLGPEGTYLQQQTTLLLRQAVERLHPSLRSVVNHYYGSDYSLEESARALEISLPAAKSRLLRGRVRLRSSLARYGITKSRC